MKKKTQFSPKSLRTIGLGLLASSMLALVGAEGIDVYLTRIAKPRLEVLCNEAGIQNISDYENKEYIRRNHRYINGSIEHVQSAINHIENIPDWKNGTYNNEFAEYPTTIPSIQLIMLKDDLERYKRLDILEGKLTAYGTITAMLGMWIGMGMSTPW
ncbi:MAG TPA: hypothetical protein VJJ23_04120 [Candidatus Nanoarchaeia archaeon]|nr:hypothetical protein [Candidatus Nanoarchaeia archaeon]